MNNGKLIIISAPSGTGKSTIISELIKDASLKLEFSVSATTRSPRAGEVNGKDYYFLSVDDFKKGIENGEFAEYQEVYPGRFYGTLKKEIQRINADGRNVILDIDVLGGINVKKMYGDSSCHPACKLCGKGFCREGQTILRKSKNGCRKQNMKCRLPKSLTNASQMMCSKRPWKKREKR